jgi:hypothetical protein
MNVHGRWRDLEKSLPLAKPDDFHNQKSSRGKFASSDATLVACAVISG